MEGIGRGLIGGTILVLPGRTWKNHEKPQSCSRSPGRDLNLGPPNANHQAATFGERKIVIYTGHLVLLGY
jgi:hypothetical protein